MTLKDKHGHMVQADGFLRAMGAFTILLFWQFLLHAMCFKIHLWCNYEICRLIFWNVYWDLQKELPTGLPYAEGTR